VTVTASDPASSAERPAGWVTTLPGLPAESDRLLARLDDLLEEAEARAQGILRTSPLDARVAARIGRLAGIAAPELVGFALGKRDLEGIVPVLAKLALHGGPTYVKLGQLIASTRGLTPEWVADSFAGCRDAVPPAPASSVEAALRASGIDQHLGSWNRTPLASASVAQVHEATLLDGREVVLKVRRPGIVRTVAGDAAYLLPLLRLVEMRSERLRVANLHGTLTLMLRLFAQEVDLRLEAASIVQMALAFERAGVDVEIPAPVPGLVTKRVLCMQRVNGVSAADEASMASFGHVAGDLVRVAVAGVLQTTMVDGLFHGDLHLGNVLVTPRGVALVDFGIIGRLSDVQRLALLSLLRAAVIEDRDGIVNALRDFGALPPDVDVPDFLAKLPPPVAMDERVTMNRKDIEERVTAVVRALNTSGFRVPPELTLFAKNLVYLGDALQRHAPDLDLFEELAAAVAKLPVP
jgi:ubiquinone biosynthesis protein